jgi:hypothetical protein
MMDAQTTKEKFKSYLFLNRGINILSAFKDCESMFEGDITRYDAMIERLKNDGELLVKNGSLYLVSNG